MASRETKSANGVATLDAVSPSEEEIDRTIDDSFPASDPPSHTPIARVGAPPEERVEHHDCLGANLRRAGLVTAGLAVIAVAIIAGGKRRASRRDATSLRGRVRREAKSVAGAAESLIEAARERAEAVASHAPAAVLPRR